MTMVDNSPFSPLLTCSKQLGPNMWFSSIFITLFYANFGKAFYANFGKTFPIRVEGLVGIFVLEKHHYPFDLQVGPLLGTQGGSWPLLNKS